MDRDQIASEIARLIAEMKDKCGTAEDTLCYRALQVAEFWLEQSRP